MTAIISLLLSLSIAEVALRLLRRFPGPIDERNTVYHYDSYLGWIPNPFMEGICRGHRVVHVKHNSLGFRDREHHLKKVPSLAVIGDSYVYGYDVEQDECFTELVQKKMPSWDIVNMGISGYGTDQEYLLLRRFLPIMKPDKVLLVFSPNDVDDNRMNRRYGYYKPYFTAHNGHLNLQGVPVPRSARCYVADHPFLFKSEIIFRVADLYLRWRHPLVLVQNPTIPLLLSMQQFLASRHIDFYVGYIEQTTPEKEFCKQARLKCLDLHTTHIYPTMGSHWTPEGHQEIANEIYTFLRQQ